MAIWERSIPGRGSKCKSPVPGIRSSGSKLSPAAPGWVTYRSPLTALNLGFAIREMQLVPSPHRELIGMRRESLQVFLKTEQHRTSLVLQRLGPQAPSAGSPGSVSALLCLTLWDPMDCGPPGSSVHGIFQARILEWVAIFPTQRLNLCLLHW